jgi:hypothetical protein
LRLKVSGGVLFAPSIGRQRNDTERFLGIWRGNNAMTAPTDSASLNSQPPLSLIGGLGAKPGDAGNDRLQTTISASRALCQRQSYKLQRNPQFAHVAGGLSDCSARRNA